MGSLHFAALASGRIVSIRELIFTEYLFFYQKVKARKFGYPTQEIKGHCDEQRFSTKGGVVDPTLPTTG